MEASNEKARLNLLMRFVGHHFRDEYQDAESLFEKGLVNSKYAKYLSGPGSVLVARENGNDIGYLQKTFFCNEAKTTWSVNAMTLAFDGEFKESDKDLIINVEDTPRRISSLDFHPLEYADPHVAQTLEARGRKFWACRKSAYVSYTGLDMNKETTYDDTRFVIDVRTYHTMHGDKTGVLKGPPALDSSVFDREEPPDDGTFIYLVPASIYGFEIQEKKWVNLQVDNINQLEWDTEAFKSLAIDEESKELINALVNNKITADKATDMVRGKGNGLIILLHGGPGTGKTLTAESVAEIAKKPLYRVTCGDIGTEPREVEKYLQKVFHLGKIWDCVVLLDEADVFLEQRTLSDLSRNALVSVFLRTLEYYDGILILTSNRVGTFDEAFKSRIQLALHYPNLTSHQRKQIWKNFIHRLDSLGEDVDIETILASINKLAKYEMNGRQIRNAITTARQLALFKKETLTTKHLDHSVRVSGKFDQYLDEVHDQIKDDDMARESAIR
ncbi:Proteasome-activating nucleotidase [Diplodia seriata]|uniref:Proteasome-activating nucleotidase n=1 Tax=Diplodia seriata TaxID=420778 RepID=A0A1S8BDX7_9PEZI|nr:Proteasome-activating nucleotidase [Diplodia seriata]OMP85741.1 Proteasome-activating nucleotidase [Diplodia seriata]